MQRNDVDENYILMEVRTSARNAKQRTVELAQDAEMKDQQMKDRILTSSGHSDPHHSKPELVHLRQHAMTEDMATIHYDGRGRNSTGEESGLSTIETKLDSNSKSNRGQTQRKERFILNPKRAIDQEQEPSGIYGGGVLSEKKENAELHQSTYKLRTRPPPRQDQQIHFSTQRPSKHIMQTLQKLPPPLFWRNDKSSLIYQGKN